VSILWSVLLDAVAVKAVLDAEEFPARVANLRRAGQPSPAIASERARSRPAGPVGPRSCLAAGLADVEGDYFSHG
jgi:hypothetical protein